MEHKKTSKRYSPEFRTRAVRMLIEHRNEYLSETVALMGISSKLGCSTDSLRSWSRQQLRDSGDLAGPTSTDLTRIKDLEREIRELRQANQILRKASVDSICQRNINLQWLLSQVFSHEENIHTIRKRNMLVFMAARSWVQRYWSRIGC